MKLTFEFPEGTKAIVISYVTEKDGAMFMSMRNVATPELSSGGTIKVDPEDPNPEKKEA